MNHRGRWTVTLILTVAGAALAALLGASGTSTARHGTMAPAGGLATLYKAVGQPLAGSAGTVRFSCQTTVPAGCYGPDQIRRAYGIQPLLEHGLNGSGRTIAIIDAYGSATIGADLAQFDSVWGLPAPPSFQVVAPFGVDATDPGTADGWAGEVSLDVEWAHVVAPNANIVLVVAKSSSDPDILDATQWVSDHNAGDVLSQSYGEAEQCMDPNDITRQHTLFAKMSSQGITLLASSGDQGAGQFTCDGSAYFKAVSTPASDPYVTGVGGTSLVADGTSGQYKSESAWNESDIFGDAAAGGGGVSILYSRPNFQAGIEPGPGVPPSRPAAPKMRTVPDVSYNAGVFTGVIVVKSGGYYRFGGTSAGSPQWAGIVAIADQLEHSRIGQMNPGLYRVGRGQTPFFRDVKSGDNSIPDLTPYQGDSFGTPIAGYKAAPGYDLVTGLGTPVALTLVPYLAINGLVSNDSGGSVGTGKGPGPGHGPKGHMHDH